MAEGARPGGRASPSTAGSSGGHAGDPTIRVEVADGVATIVLDRPDALNALTVPMKGELLRALRAAARDASVRAIVLTGAGRAFCAGQDLKERLAPGAAPLGEEIRERYNPIVLAMRSLEKPIVAAVNGVAAGAGASLAFAADLRIASETASFVLAFGRIGLIPDSGATWFLPRLLGGARAAEMMLLDDPVSAAEALRIGLVARVVPPDALAAEAHAIAVRLARGAPRALAYAKRALDGTFERDLPSALDYEAYLQDLAGSTSDHAEGIAAFVEKRPPTFTGE